MPSPPSRPTSLHQRASPVSRVSSENLTHLNTPPASSPLSSPTWASATMALSSIPTTRRPCPLLKKSYGKHWTKHDSCSPHRILCWRQMSLIGRVVSTQSVGERIKASVLLDRSSESGLGVIVRSIGLRSLLL